jgi:exodeoxyribonuclease V alpha subunit
MQQDTTGLTKLDVRIISGYYKPETGWGFFDVELLNSKNNNQENSWAASAESAKITGEFERKYFRGEEFYMYGVYADHPKFGPQWQVKFVQAKFDTPDRIKSFLYQCAAKGVIDQLVNKYKDQDIVKLIMDNNVDYSDIKGMGDHRFTALREKIIENEQMKDVIIGLSQYGITPNQMKKICAKFGARAVQAIEENPYNLCKIKGIGFQKADDIAKNMGFDMDSPFRIQEGIRYILIEAMGEGHSWLSSSELLRKGMEILSVKDTLIDEQLDKIEDVIDHEGKYALMKVYKAEKYIAERLKEMNVAGEPLDFDVEAFIVEQEANTELLPNGFTDEQKQFFYNIRDYGVNFLIGNAGCGKTFMLQFAIAIFEKLNLQYQLVAPTGKAAKVLSGYAKRLASTIHRAFKIFGKEDDDAQAKFFVYDDEIVFLLSKKYYEQSRIRQHG